MGNKYIRKFSRCRRSVREKSGSETAVEPSESEIQSPRALWDKLKELKQRVILTESKAAARRLLHEEYKAKTKALEKIE